MMKNVLRQVIKELYGMKSTNILLLGGKVVVDLKWLRLGYVLCKYQYHSVKAVIMGVFFIVLGGIPAYYRSASLPQYKFREFHREDNGHVLEVILYTQLL